MPMKVTRKLPPFQGSVAASSTVTCQIPIGLSVENIFLVYATITLAQMTNIVISANNRDVINFRSGTELDRFNQFEGRAAASGILALDLTRFGLRTREAEELTRYGTGLAFDPKQTLANGQRNPFYNPSPIASLTLRIDTAATGTISGYYVGSLPSPTGLIRKITRVDPPSFNAGSGNTYAGLPKGDDINKLFLWATDITDLSIDREAYRVFDRTDTLNDLIQTDGVRVPTSNAYVFDPTEMGNGAETLETRGVGDLVVNITKTASGTAPMSLDTIGPLGV